jgi:hypothetical protein
MAKNLKRFLSLKYYYRKSILFTKRNFPRFYNKHLSFEDARLYYLNRTNKLLRYSHVHDMNEKLFWIHRYCNDPLVVKCSDKYLMREYVKDCGCDNILIPLYGVWDNANDIDFDSLPSKFVLKCNHGCGYNIICKDKSTFDTEDAKQTLNRWMSEKYGVENNEYHYSKITPKIICEQYLDSADDDSLTDYKIHCINGKPQFVLVCSDRDVKKRTVNLVSYSLDWKRLPYLKNEGQKDIPQPLHLNEMIEYATRLSKPFPYVRVDFYYVDDKIYIGELTFTPAGNIMDYYKDSTLQMMGKELVLPEKKNEGYFKSGN